MVSNLSRLQSSSAQKVHIRFTVTGVRKGKVYICRRFLSNILFCLEKNVFVSIGFRGINRMLMMNNALRIWV